jgi:hypothetical protein
MLAMPPRHHQYARRPRRAARQKMFVDARHHAQQNVLNAIKRGGVKRVDMLPLFLIGDDLHR